MAIRIFVGESMVYRVAGLLDEMFATGEMVTRMEPPFPRAIEEFAVECSIIKVLCSEILDYVVDEAVQIHGGYGYTEEFPVARAYRDARINRIFEGTSEINRLFIPTMLMRRAQRGRLPLIEAIGRVQNEILSLRPMGGGAEAEPLEAVGSLLAQAKRLILFLSSLAYQRFGEELTEEQEVLAGLADLIMEVFACESAWLRTMKAGGGEQGAEGKRREMEAMTLVYLDGAVGRMERTARGILASLAEGDELRGHLGVVRRLLRWLPLNTTALRRRIAHRVCERDGYLFP
jgi:hypothetical protein